MGFNSDRSWIPLQGPRTENKKEKLKKNLYPGAKNQRNIGELVQDSRQNIMFQL